MLTHWISSTHLYLHKHINNFWSCSIAHRTSRGLIVLIDGYILGDMITLQLRCTRSWSKEIWLHLFFQKFGRMLPCSDTRSSSDYLCMTGQIQEISFTKNPFTCPHITMLYAAQALKKLQCICSGTVILQTTTRIPFWVTDTEVSLFMMRLCFWHKHYQHRLPWKSLLWDAGIFRFREMGRS